MDLPEIIIGCRVVVEMHYADAVTAYLIKDGHSGLTQRHFQHVVKTSTGIVAGDRLKTPLLTLPTLQLFPVTYEGLVLVNQRNLQQDFYSRPETSDEEHKLSCFKLLTRPVQKIQSVAQQGGSISPLRGIFFYV